MSNQFIFVMAVLGIVILFAGYILHSKSSDQDNKGKHS